MAYFLHFKASHQSRHQYLKIYCQLFFIHHLFLLEKKEVKKTILKCIQIF